MPPYHIEVEYTPEFIKQAASAIQRRERESTASWAQVLPILILVLALYFGGVYLYDKLQLSLPFTERESNFAGTAWLLATFIYWLERRTWAQRYVEAEVRYLRARLTEPVVRWEFTENGYMIDKSISGEQGSWKALGSVARYSEIWVLTTSPNEFHPLPLDRLSPDLQDYLVTQVKTNGGAVI